MVGKIVSDIISQAKIQSDRLSRNRPTDKDRQTDGQHCYSPGLRLHSARFENTSLLHRSGNRAGAATWRIYLSQSTRVL